MLDEMTKKNASKFVRFEDPFNGFILPEMKNDYHI